MTTEAIGVGRAGERLAAVDGLRGYALLGLFLVHMCELFELYWAIEVPPSAIHDAVFGIFAGKSYAIFALCFGFGVFAMMDGEARRGRNFTGRLAWRLGILLVIGLLHGLIYRGDIIQVLAVSGLLMLAINRIRSLAWLWAIAAVFFLQPWMLFRIAAALSGQAWAVSPPNFTHDPAMPIYLTGTLAQTLVANLWDGLTTKWWFMFESGRISQIMGLFVVGLILGRADFFGDGDRLKRVRRIAIPVLLVATLARRVFRGDLTTLLFHDSLGGADWVWTMMTGAWIDLGWTMLSVLLFVEVWHRLGGRILGWLAPAGRMTLTLYIVQSLVFVPVFYGFGLGGYQTIVQTQAFLIGIVAFGVQMLFASWWFTRYRYGPLEWGLRSLTWLKPVPLRRS